MANLVKYRSKYSSYSSGRHIWAGEWRILPELPHLQSKNSSEVYNVIITHQPKVQRLIKRSYETFSEMALLRISVISVAYSVLYQTVISVNFHFSCP